MKIVTVFPVHPNVDKHGAQMVFHELVLALADEAEDLEFIHVGPKGFAPPLDQRLHLPIEGIGNHWDTLWFEQFQLPRMLKHMSADLLLIPYEYAPLGSPIPIVVFEILGSNESISGLAGRLLRGTRRAGVQGVSKHLIFSDLAGSRKVGANLHVVDPWVHANFRALSDAGDRETVAGHGLPYSYVLAHGISLADITPILAAWTWVDGSVGDTVPLAVIVSEGVERRTWEEEVRQMGLTHSVQLLAGVAFDELPALYRRAEVLLHGGVAVEPQILRWAMACGLPVTGFDEPKASGVLGSAGYLVDAGDTRALGAACLTVIVEPEVKDRLRNAGLMRASAFHTQPGPAQVIRGILEKKGV